MKGGYYISAELLMRVSVWQGLKQASLGQYILKAIKSSSVIPPLSFVLSIEIDHVTESYW